MRCLKLLVSQCLPQELNPLPFLGIVFNCTAWLLYGTLTKDPYVYFSNILGLPLGIFYVFTSVKFASEKVSRHYAGPHVVCKHRLVVMSCAMQQRL
jgi:hypothetical protein